MSNYTEPDCEKQVDLADAQSGPPAVDTGAASSLLPPLGAPSQPAPRAAGRKRYFDRDKWLAEDAERRERARQWYAGQPPLERPRDRPGNDALQFVNEVLGRLGRRV